MAEDTRTEHTGKLAVRRDNARAEYVLRAMFELWLLQALDKSNAIPSRLELKVECGD